MRAAHYGLPLMLAIIGGSPQRFTPYVELYQQTLERFGKPLLPIGVHSPGHVAATDEQAKEELWPHYEGLMNRIGARARLAADRPRAVRARGRARRRAVRRLARDGGDEDRRDGQGARPVALRPEVQQRHAAARQADDEHRAVRHEGRAARATAPGLMAVGFGL